MPIDRTVAPAFQPINKISFTEPEFITLQNGMDASLIHKGEQDVMRIEWIAQSGRWFEPRPGTSYFGLKMLGEGAGSMNSEALSEAFQQYGAFLELTNGFDYSTLAVYTLTRHLEPVLELIYLMLTEPLFQEKELETLKNIKVQKIRLNLEKNNITASQTFRNCIFGNDHPYGKEMTEAQATEIKPNMLREYYKDRLLHNSQLILSGKFEDTHLKLINDNLGRIEYKTDPVVYQFPVNPIKEVRKSLEGSLQTSIRYGKRFLTMSDPDFIPMQFLNEILGGYFGSRLMKNIREDKGFTYGIYSSTIALKEEGYFVIGTDVKKEDADQTIDEIHKEIDRLIHERVEKEGKP
jgi:predicted Zn-dependent peptidase